MSMDKEIMMDAVTEVAEKILGDESFIRLARKSSDAYRLRLKQLLPSAAALMIGEYERKMSASEEEKETLKAKIQEYGIPLSLYLDDGKEFPTIVPEGARKRIRRLTEVKGGCPLGHS